MEIFNKIKKIFQHRGRFQAQGGGLEESENWAQDNALTVDKALKLISKLENKLQKRDYQIRKKPFNKARRFVIEAGKNGGVNSPSTKSWKVKKSKDLRVDIEVHSGTAFVNVEIEDDEK